MTLSQPHCCQRPLSAAPAGNRGCVPQGLTQLLTNPEISELLTKGAQRQTEGVLELADAAGLRGLAVAAAANTEDVVRHHAAGHASQCTH